MKIEIRDGISDEIAIELVGIVVRQDGGVLLASKWNNKRRTMNEVSIIVNGMRFDAVNEEDYRSCNRKN